MTFEQVRDVIMETLNCDADSVTPDARLREDLRADSLAAVDCQGAGGSVRRYHCRRAAAFSEDSWRHYGVFKGTYGVKAWKNRSYMN